MARSKPNSIFPLCSVNVVLLTGLCGWSVLKRAINYSVCTWYAGTMKGRYTQNQQICRYPPGSIFITEKKQIIFLPNQILCFLLVVVIYCNHIIFLSLPLSWFCCYTQAGHFAMKKDPFAFFPPNASAYLTQSIFYTSIHQAFPLCWNPCNLCLQTGLQCGVTGVICSTTVIRVISSATHVKINTFPLLWSGKFMSQRQREDGGSHVSWSLLEDVTKVLSKIPVWYTDSGFTYRSATEASC